MTRASHSVNHFQLWFVCALFSVIWSLVSLGHHMGSKTAVLVIFSSFPKSENSLDLALLIHAGIGLWLVKLKIRNSGKEDPFAHYGGKDKSWFAGILSFRFPRIRLHNYHEREKEFQVLSQIFQSSSRDFFRPLISSEPDLFVESSCLLNYWNFQGSFSCVDPIFLNFIQN